VHFNQNNQYLGHPWQMQFSLVGTSYNFISDW